jgi:hypothetical protein
MTIYAFDVDDTLDLSGGPVPMATLVALRHERHVVGLCGNWALVTRAVPGWHDVVSFVGPIGSTKGEMLEQLRAFCPADDYVMVGNDPAVFGNSDDVGAAREAGWRFISEHDFAAGAR